MATGPIGLQGSMGPTGRAGIQGRVGHQGTPYGYPGWSFYSPGGVAYVSNVSLDSSSQWFVDLGNVPYGGFLTVQSRPPGYPWTSIKMPDPPPPAGTFWVITWVGEASPYQLAPIINGTLDQYPTGSTSTYPQGTSTNLRLDAKSTYYLMYSGSGSNYIVI